MAHGHVAACTVTTQHSRCGDHLPGIHQRQAFFSVIEHVFLRTKG
jgi:hypothetical protein